MEGVISKEKLEKKRMEHTEIEFNGQVYHAFYEKSNISIYASRFINLIQILDLSHQDFVDIGNSFKRPGLYVLTRTHVIVYSPYYSDYGSINFRMIKKYQLDDHYNHMMVSKNGDYIVLTKEGKITTLRIFWGYSGISECQRIEDLMQIASLGFDEHIKNHQLSHDDRYLATLGDVRDKIYVWDFESILEAGGSEGSKDVLRNYCLKNNSPFTHFYFRWSNTIQNAVTKTPNVLLTIDTHYFIKIWVENIVKNNFTFYMAYMIRLEDIPLSVHHIETIWVNFLTRKAALRRSQEYLSGDSKHGTYSLSRGSPIILAVLVPFTRLELYRLYNVFNVEMQILADDSIILDHSVFKQMKNILMIRMRDSSIAQIFGLDAGGNLIKIQLNMKNPEQIILFSNVGEKMSNIRDYFINENDQVYAYLNHENEFYVEKIVANSVPRAFHKHKPSHLLKITQFCSIQDEFSFFFTNGDIVFFIPEELDKIIMFHTNYGDKMFISSSNLAQKIGYEAGMSSIPNIRVLDQTAIQPITGAAYSRLLIECDSDVFLVDLKYNYSKINQLMNESAGSDDQTPVLASIFYTDLLHNLTVSGVDFRKNPVIRCKVNHPDEIFIAFRHSRDTLKIYDVDIKKKLERIIFTQKFKNEIKNFNVSQLFPYYVTVVDQENQIFFYDLKGKLYTKFDLKKFLDNRSKKSLNQRSLSIGVFKLKSSYFIILVDNFVLISCLRFDIALQRYVLVILTRYKNSNELYYGSFDDYAYKMEDDVRLLNNGILFTKTKNSFHILDDNFDKRNFIFLNKTRMLNNMNFKILEYLRPSQGHNPSNILKILSVGGFGCVVNIVEKFVKASRKLLMSEKKQEIEFSEDLIDNFRIDYDEYQDWLEQDFKMKFNIDKCLEGKIDILNDALSLIRQKEAHLSGSDSIVLEEILKIMIDQYNNKRGQDPFSCIFALNVRFFNLGKKNIWGFTRHKALKSNEVIWAFHSDQQEVLFEICFPKHLQTQPSIFNWKAMTEYCVPMWYNDNLKLRSNIEKLALLEFKKNKNPDDVILWYVILEKLPILISLYRSVSPPNPKMVKFLSNNFKQERWIKAAGKNAFVLLSKKRYLMSAAFFMLAGKVKDAVDVIVNNMKDLQLAIAVCKLKENVFSKKIEDKPILRGLIEDQLIERGKAINDLWLVSIGYTMLGKHIKSLNAISKILEEERNIEGDEIEKHWPSTFFPLTSAFNPSALILIELLKSSFKVKRELEGGATQRVEQNSIFAGFMSMNGPPMPSAAKSDAEKIDLNMDFIYQKCYNYFYYNRSPLLALTLYRESQIPAKQKNIIGQMTKTYIRQLFIYFVGVGDWKNFFSGLRSEIKSLSDKGHIDRKEAYEITEKLIKNLKGPKLLASWHLAFDDGERALQVTNSLSLELQNMSLYIVKSNNFELKPSTVWETTLNFIEELSECLILLEQKMELFSRRTDDKAYSVSSSSSGGFFKDNPDLDDMNFREKVVVTVMQIAHTFFLVCINLGCWDISLEIIKEVRLFMSKVKRNNDYISWAEFEPILIRKHIEKLREVLEKLPQFMFISPSHYNESNNLRIAIEGVVKVERDFESFPDLKNISQILLKTLFKWMFNNEFKNIYEANFKIDYILDITSYKIQSVSSLRAYVNEYSKYLKHDFLMTFSKLRIDEQVKASEEIKAIISPGEKNLILMVREFTILQQEDVMEYKMKAEYNSAIDVSYFVNKIEEMAYLNLFTYRNYDNDQTIEEYKKKLISEGIEIVKYKLEKQTGFSRMMSSQIFNSLAVIKDNYTVELLVLANKRLMKYNLFNCLFNKMRQNQGYRVLDYENLGGRFSGNYDQGGITSIDEEDLSKRPLPLRVIYNGIFAEKLKKNLLGIKNMNWNQLSYILFEDKNYMAVNMNEISQCCTHPNFPIIFAGQKSSILIIYSKTMTAVAELTSGNSEIIKIVINNLGDRVIAIDSKGSLYVWRFNLLLIKQRPSIILKKIDAVDACFTTNSSSIAILTKNCLYHYDLLKSHKSDINEFKVEVVSGGTAMKYLPKYKRCVVVLGKKGRVEIYDFEEKLRVDSLDTGNRDVTSCEVNELGTVFALGYNDGVIEFYKSKGMTLMNTFEPFADTVEKRSARSIVMMTKINAYLIAGCAGGIISIINRM